MLSLPLSSSPLREMFSLADLADYRNLPTFQRALAGCRNTVKQAGVRSAQALTMRANGEIWLIAVGKRGAWKKLWNFGNPLASAS